jgi:4-amino-4-deoxy-L-arabinose transferase-like glycosyltransferase
MTYKSIRQAALPVLSVLSVLAGILMRIAWLAAGRIPFNSDEAIVGLMARHILQGERPVFFYGQAYMGSLDAWLIALGFKVFGSNVITMRVVQIILWVLLCASAALLARRLFHSPAAGWWTLLLIGIPPVNQVLYSTVTLGGYNEALIIGLWSLYLAVVIMEESTSPKKYRIVLLGLITGFGLWVFGFSLVFSLPAVVFVCIHLIKQQKTASGISLNALLLLVGGIIGALPWWIYAFANGFGPLLRELTGSAVAVEKTAWLGRMFTHLIGLVVLGLPAAAGFRPPWSALWILLPAIPVVLFLCIVILLAAVRNYRQYAWMKLLLAVPLTLFVLFVFTAFGVDPSGRYFLPISLIFTVLCGGVFAGWSGKWRWMPVACALIFVAYQGIGSMRAVDQSTTGLTTQFAPDTSIQGAEMVKLLEYLEQNGIQTGFSDYWTAYPTAFLSDEKILLVPRLPYHHNLTYTLRDDRYNPYTQKVYASTDRAYISYRNSALDQLLESKFTSEGITWKMDEISGFHVYHDLSRDITPEELGLGAAGVKR